MVFIKRVRKKKEQKSDVAYSTRDDSEGKKISLRTRTYMSSLPKKPPRKQCIKTQRTEQHNTPQHHAASHRNPPNPNDITARAEKSFYEYYVSRAVVLLIVVVFHLAKDVVCHAEGPLQGDVGIGDLEELVVGYDDQSVHRVAQFVDGRRRLPQAQGRNHKT